MDDAPIVDSDRESKYKGIRAIAVRVEGPWYSEREQG
jgi:hypothetical protein